MGCWIPTAFHTMSPECFDPVWHSPITTLITVASQCATCTRRVKRFDRVLSRLRKHQCSVLNAYLTGYCEEHTWTPLTMDLNQFLTNTPLLSTLSKEFELLKKSGGVCGCNQSVHAGTWGMGCARMHEQRDHASVCTGSCSQRRLRGMGEAADTRGCAINDRNKGNSCTCCTCTPDSCGCCAATSSSNKRGPSCCSCTITRRSTHTARA